MQQELVPHTVAPSVHFHFLPYSECLNGLPLAVTTYTTEDLRSELTLPIPYTTQDLRSEVTFPGAHNMSSPLVVVKLLYK